MRRDRARLRQQIPGAKGRRWHGEGSSSVAGRIGRGNGQRSRCSPSGRTDRQRDITAGREAGEAEVEYVSSPSRVVVEPDRWAIDQAQIVEGIVVADIGLDAAGAKLNSGREDERAAAAADIAGRDR